MSMQKSHKDIEVILRPGPGALAEFGEILGRAGVSLEGGGLFTLHGTAVAHFLVDDADAGRTALDAHGVGPVTINNVVTTRLAQDVPGQLGAFMRRLADAGVDVLVQYSDHDHRLVLVVPTKQHAIASEIAAAWDIAPRSREKS